jgi:hypothetical protein
VSDLDGHVDVRLRPVCVLRNRHVTAALEGTRSDARNVTVWIHKSTLGIEKACFAVPSMENVFRICVWGPEPPNVGVPLHTRADVLCVFVAKLGAYEPALVDLIREFVSIMGGGDESHETHCVGEAAFIGLHQSRACDAPRLADPRWCPRVPQVRLAVGGGAA